MKQVILKRHFLPVWSWLKICMWVNVCVYIYIYMTEIAKERERKREREREKERERETENENENVKSPRSYPSWSGTQPPSPKTPTP